MAQGDPINDFFTVSVGSTVSVSIPSGQVWRIEVAGNADGGRWDDDDRFDYGGTFFISDSTNDFFPGPRQGNDTDALSGKSHDEGSNSGVLYVGGGTFPLSDQYDMNFNSGTEGSRLMGYMGVQTK